MLRGQVPQLQIMLCAFNIQKVFNEFILGLKKRLDGFICLG